MIDTQLKLHSGCKVILEELIVISIWTSAIYKMNIQSLIEFTLILGYYFSRSTRMINFVLIMNTVIFLGRLVFTLSNMIQDLNPMDYPTELQGCIYKT